jgi:hypothetical protein
MCFHGSLFAALASSDIVQRCLSEIVPLKLPMDTGKVLKYAVVVAGMKRSSDSLAVALDHVLSPASSK